MSAPSLSEALRGVPPADVKHMLTTLYLAQCGVAVAPSSSPDAALAAMFAGESSGLCGKVFKEGDIVYNCRTCEVDPTCVQCAECFHDANHKGHDVFFHMTGFGGCCDCGDVEAWSPEGFCSRHKGVKAKVAASDAPDSTHALLEGLPPPIARGLQSGLIPQALQHVLAVARALKAAYDSVPPADSPDDWHVVVHNDDVHTVDEVEEAFQTHAHVNGHQAAAMTERVDKAGEAVVYVGPVASAAAVATGLRGSCMRDCGYVRKGLLVTLESAQLRAQVAQAPAVVDWITHLANLSDGFGRVVGMFLCLPLVEILPLLTTSSGALSPLAEPGSTAALDAAASSSGGGVTPLPTYEPLASLLSLDPDLPKPLCESLHALYMSIMKDSVFRQLFAMSFASAFPALTLALSECRGPMAGSLYDFGVHIFTVPSIVNRLVFKHGFAFALLDSLRMCIASASKPDESAAAGTTVLNLGNSALVHKRFVPILRDIQYVCRVPDVALHMAADPDAMAVVMDVLALSSGMDSRKLEKSVHVLYESTSWLAAFNLALSLLTFVVAFSDNAFKLEPEVAIGGAGAAPAAAHEKGLQATRCALSRCVDAIFQATLRPGGAWVVETRTVRFDVQSQPASFHVPLHRALAKVVSRLSLASYPNILTVLSDATRSCAGGDAAMGGLALLEPPLRTAVMAAQVKRGWWVRNGDSVANELFNYIHPPQCLSFYDGDVQAISLAASQLHPDHFVSVILDRFGVLESALAVAPVLGSNADAAKQCMAMTEDAFRLLIDIVTFTPSRPAWMESRAPAEKRLVNVVGARKELVHALMCGPKPRSKLVKSAELAMFGLGQERIPDDVLTELIEAVATFRPPQGMDAGVYVLKDEATGEYDPFFHHLPHKEQMEARERWVEKRTATAPSHPVGSPEYLAAARPIAPAPPAPLPAFCPVRRVLLCSTVVCFVRGVLRDVVGGIELRASPSLLSSSLHLFTLALHCWPASRPPYAAVSASDADSALLAALTEEELALTPGFVTAVTEVSTVPPGRGASGSVVSLLRALMSKDSTPQVAVEGAAWCLERMRTLDPVLASAVTAELGEAFQKEAKPKDSAKERMLAAQQRAREAMLRQQAAFASMFADDEEEEEGAAGAADGEGGEVAAALAPPAYQEPEPECIFCHESVDNPLGYLGLVVQSTVGLYVDGERGHALRSAAGWGDAVGWLSSPAAGAGAAASAAVPPAPVPFGSAQVPPSRPTVVDAVLANLATRDFPDVQEGLRSTRPLLRFCGHALHHSCYEMYFRSQIRSQSDEHLSPGEGEFLCPLCKSLSNAFFRHKCAKFREVTSATAAPLEPLADDVWFGPFGSGVTAGPVPPPAWAGALPPRAEEDASEGDDASASIGSSESVLRTEVAVGPDAVHIGGIATLYAGGNTVRAAALQVGWSTAADAEPVAVTKGEALVLRTPRALAAALGNSVQHVAVLPEATLQLCKEQFVTLYSGGTLAAATSPADVGMRKFLSNDVPWSLTPSTLEAATLADCDPFQTLLFSRLFVPSYTEFEAVACRVLDVHFLRAVLIACAVAQRSPVATPSTAPPDLVPALSSVLRLVGLPPSTVAATANAATKFSALQTTVEALLDCYVRCARLTLALLRPPVDPATVSPTAHPIVLPTSRFERKLHALLSVFTGLSPPAASTRTADDLSVLRSVFAQWTLGTEGKLVCGALSELSADLTVTVPRVRRVSLVDLPDSFDALCAKFLAATCRSCGRRPTTPVVCLVCGEYLCGGDECCKVREVGECTRHARQCSAGNGIFLLFKTSAILLTRKLFSCYYASPYLDQHGEEDVGLKRGRPLVLSRARYQLLQEMWATAETAREITRTRVSAERYIRKGWF